MDRDARAQPRPAQRHARSRAQLVGSRELVGVAHGAKLLPAVVGELILARLVVLVVLRVPIIDKVLHREGGVAARDPRELPELLPDGWRSEKI